MIHRPRRLRGNSIIRDLAAQVNPDKSRLIMPYFVLEGEGKREPVKSMPGIDRVSRDNLIKDLKDDIAAGVRSILLFGIPDFKDSAGSEAYSENGVVQQALRLIKREFGNSILVITDVCLCEFTDHGHCGLVENGQVLNDATLELLARTAVSHAEAGAHIVAPSDMMDGRVGVIRKALDEKGYVNTPVMAYSAKYCSAFYGPFRDAAGSAPQFGDRQTYQMDPRNSAEAEREVLLDIEEGADIVMVKPALSYLDIVNKIRGITSLPLCVYNVSGEYSMVKAAAEKGLIDEEKIVREIMTSFFRAGADMVISYHTRDILKNQWF